MTRFEQQSTETILFGGVQQKTDMLNTIYVNILHPISSTKDRQGPVLSSWDVFDQTVINLNVDSKRMWV